MKKRFEIRIRLEANKNTRLELLISFTEDIKSLLFAINNGIKILLLKIDNPNKITFISEQTPRLIKSFDFMNFNTDNIGYYLEEIITYSFDLTPPASTKKDNNKTDFNDTMLFPLI